MNDSILLFRSALLNIVSFKPDQIVDVLGDDNESILYLCEEKSDTKPNGIHGRNSGGQYFPVITGSHWDTETTGLAFSPNKKFMYVAFQRNPGIIFEISRSDNLPFGGDILDINYNINNYF